MPPRGRRASMAPTGIRGPDSAATARHQPPSLPRHARSALGPAGPPKTLRQAPQGKKPGTEASPGRGVELPSRWGRGATRHTTKAGFQFKRHLPDLLLSPCCSPVPGRPAAPALTGLPGPSRPAQALLRGGGGHGTRARDSGPRSPAGGPSRSSPSAPGLSAGPAPVPPVRHTPCPPGPRPRLGGRTHRRRPRLRRTPWRPPTGGKTRWWWGQRIARCGFAARRAWEGPPAPSPGGGPAARASCRPCCAAAGPSGLGPRGGAGASTPDCSRRGRRRNCRSRSQPVLPPPTPPRKWEKRGAPQPSCRPSPAEMVLTCGRQGLWHVKPQRGSSPLGRRRPRRVCLYEGWDAVPRAGG